VARSPLKFLTYLCIGLGALSFAARAGQEQRNLQLEVFINNTPVGIIGSFVLLDNNRLGTTRNELEEIGLRINPQRFPADIIVLDDIPTLKYEYEERTQSVRFTVDNAARVGRKFDLRDGASVGGRPAQAGWGAILNYDVLGTTGSLQYFRPLSSGGMSLTAEARAFSPYGTFEQSGIVRTVAQQSSEFIRLNTAVVSSDQERMISYRAGDTINGGLAWSRPIRIGGLQVQSNFALRPDLVTIPLPTLGGTAVVPSTVDVYVNNIKTFSQDVGAGPFSVSNVPLITGAGNAALVIRDSSGHETKTTTPFYASGSLLAPGLSSWSLEAGLPRLSFGSVADSYVQSPVGSATLRKGIFDGLTVEGHGEAGAGVTNVGAGAVVRTGTFGVASAAISSSRTDSGKGQQAYLAYETGLFGLIINASSQRTFGSYDDLASVTARLQTPLTLLQNVSGIFSYVPVSTLAYVIPAGSAASALLSLYDNARPPQAVDRITFSAPLPFDVRSNLSASFVHLRSAANLSNIVSGSYTRVLPYNASLFATVFRDYGVNRNTGLFAGLSMPFGESASISTGVSGGTGGKTIYADAVKQLSPEPGSYGWRARESEGASFYREASLSYRSSIGTVLGGASQDRSGSRATLELRGSITTMDRDVFLSNWIDDGFAIVSAGTPGLEVRHDNRAVGVTDGQGKLLVPSLRSYQNNKITIDPSNLPIDAEIERTSDSVTPAHGAGLLVNFKVRNNTASALVTFVRGDGSFVPAGSAGRIEGGDEFTVGYDGQSFIQNLKRANSAAIEFLDGKCSASFEFTPKAGEQVQIGPVLCS
jgi:outer membrane usher protein